MGAGCRTSKGKDVTLSSAAGVGGFHDRTQVIFGKAVITKYVAHALSNRGPEPAFLGIRPRFRAQPGAAKAVVATPDNHTSKPSRLALLDNGRDR